MWPTAANSQSLRKKWFLFFHVIWKQGIIATNWHIGCSVWPISFGDMAYNVMSMQRYSDLRKLLWKVQFSGRLTFHTYPSMHCWKVGIWGGDLTEGPVWPPSMLILLIGLVGVGVFCNLIAWRFICTLMGSNQWWYRNTLFSKSPE